MTKKKKKKTGTKQEEEEKGVGPSDANLSTPEILSSPVGCAIFCREGVFLIFSFYSIHPHFIFVFFFPQLTIWNIIIKNRKKRGGRLLFVRSTGHLSHPISLSIFLFIIILFLLLLTFSMFYLSRVSGFLICFVDSFYRHKRERERGGGPSFRVIFTLRQYSSLKKTITRQKKKKKKKYKFIKF